LIGYTIVIAILVIIGYTITPYQH